MSSTGRVTLDIAFSMSLINRLSVNCRTRIEVVGWLMTLRSLNCLMAMISSAIPKISWEGEGLMDALGEKEAELEVLGESDGDNELEGL